MKKLTFILCALACAFHSQAVLDEALNSDHISSESNDTGRRDIFDLSSCMNEALKINSNRLVIRMKRLNAVNMENLMNFLNNNKNIEWLDIATCCIDEGACGALGSALASQTSLKYLNLSHTNDELSPMNDHDAQAIASGLKSNTSLRFLYLTHNKIGPQGAKAFGECLKVNSALQVLDLDSNDIGDAGAEALADGMKENTSLKRLNIEANRIGGKGAKAFGECLKQNSTLESLNVMYNWVDNRGVKFLAEALKCNFTLKELNLLHNNVEKRGARSLRSVFEINHNTDLKIYMDDPSYQDIDNPSYPRRVLVIGHNSPKVERLRKLTFVGHSLGTEFSDIAIQFKNQPKENPEN